MAEQADPHASAASGRPTLPISAEPSATRAAYLAHFQEVTRQLLPLPAWLARHSLGMTSQAARQALWARARRITGNEDIGFALAERISLERLTGPLWGLFRTAPSLRALFASWPEWQTLLFDEVKLTVVDRGTQVWVGGIPPRGVIVDRAEHDVRAATLIKILQLHEPEAATLQAARFTYARPRSVGRHQVVLGTHDLSFEQPMGELAVSRALFDAPLPGADAQEFARLHGAAARAARMPAPSLTDRVDEAATWLLATPGATAQAVARQLGMSVRSLRRHLADEGDTFRALIDRVRQREVELFVETGLYTMKQLAERVGFANDRALRHALRRWQARQR